MSEFLSGKLFSVWLSWCPRQIEMNLLDVTQEGHPSQDPVIRGQHRAQVHHGDEGEVSPPGFLVDRTHVQLRILGRRGVNGKNMQNRKLREENLRGGFCELPVPPVPGCSIHIQPVNIHAFRWGRDDLFLGLPQDFIVDGHSVQRPAFVSSGHFLIFF